jgi:hypothetical protein
MTTKHDVMRVHAEHPDWSMAQVAAELGCLRQYVQATCKRYDIPIPRGSKRGVSHKTKARLLEAALRDLRTSAALLTQELLVARPSLFISEIPPWFRDCEASIARAGELLHGKAP